MLFPASAKKAIASAFYDKEVAVLSSRDTVDAEGGVVRGVLATKAHFMGNVQFTALHSLQAEIGLVENIDIAITCENGVPVALNDLLEYQNKRYVVTDVLPYDSHTMIVGRKWQSA